MYICSASLSGIEIRQVEYNDKLNVSNPKIIDNKNKNFLFSHDNQIVLLYTKTIFSSKEFPDKYITVARFDHVNAQLDVLYEFPVPNIMSIQFSPQSSYFCVISRRNHITDAEKIPLVKVVKTVSGEVVRSFNYDSRHIPTIFWSINETIFAYSYTDGILFFQTEADNSETRIPFEAPNLHSCSFSEGKKGIRFAVVYDRSPFKMKIFSFPQLEQIAYRPIITGDTFNVTISPNGFSAISIGYQIQDDTTFYGTSSLSYLNENGQQKLSIKKEGPITHASYSPDGDKLIVIAGHVPPAVYVYHDKIGSCVPLGEFNFNSIRHSCSPDIAVFGGFGSFSGSIRTVNLSNKAFLSQGEAPFTSEWGWSPCGRLILTAVMMPKMNVDNEFSIYDHMCQKLFSLRMTEQTQCQWIGNENPLPLPDIKKAQVVKEAPKAYVPPHLRKNGEDKKNYPPGFRPKK